MGQWQTAKVIKSDAASVSIEPASAAALQLFSDVCAKEGECLVRYAWKAVPFNYMKASVYAKDEGFPAGSFLLKVA